MATDTTMPYRHLATDRRCSPAASRHSSPATANMLSPFAMYVAFPRSDYYEDSAPPRCCRLTTSLPVPGLAGRGEGGHQGGSHVHC